MSVYAENRMIEAQAARITKLNKDIDELNIKLKNVRSEYREPIEKMSAAYNYYMNLQKLIQTDDNLMDAWQDFLLALKMKEPNADEILSRMYNSPFEK